MKALFVVGLTGGIACGKSEVTRLLRERGVPIVDADVVARQLVEPGTQVLRQLVDVFGDGILQADGALDRKRLGRLVFGDRDALEQLNAIMHPAIWQSILKNLGELAVTEDVAVLVAPLLLEHGAEAIVDTVWVVGCNPEKQLERLQKRDNLDEAEAIRRIAAQMPLAAKYERADYVIENDGNLEELAKQVELAWEFVCKRQT